VPGQLSVSSVTTVISGAGTFPLHCTEIEVGFEAVGEILSSTLMVWLRIAVFPHASVAVHVLVIEYSFGHDPGTVTSANVNVGVPQLSVAVGVVHDGVPEHSIVVGAGNAEIVGGVVSSTLIV